MIFKKSKEIIKENFYISFLPFDCSCFLLSFKEMNDQNTYEKKLKEKMYVKNFIN
jgi:hypothetical protein